MPNGNVTAASVRSSVGGIQPLGKVANRRKAKDAALLNQKYWIRIICKAFTNDRLYAVLSPLQQAGVVRMLPIGTAVDERKAILVVTLDDSLAYDEAKLADRLKDPGFVANNLPEAKTMLSAMGIIRLPDHTDTTSKRQRLYYAPERTDGTIISRLQVEAFRTSGRMNVATVHGRLEDWMSRVIGRAGHSSFKEQMMPGNIDRFSFWFRGM